MLPPRICNRGTAQNGAVRSYALRAMLHPLYCYVECYWTCRRCASRVGDDFYVMYAWSCNRNRKRSRDWVETRGAWYDWEVAHAIRWSNQCGIRVELGLGRAIVYYDLSQIRCRAGQIVNLHIFYWMWGCSKILQLNQIWVIASWWRRIPGVRRKEAYSNCGRVVRRRNRNGRARIHCARTASVWPCQEPEVRFLNSGCIVCIEEHVYRRASASNQRRQKQNEG